MQVNNFRAFVGSVTDDVDEESLRKSLEEAFGEVENIDIIPTKVYFFFFHFYFLSCKGKKKKSSFPGNFKNKYAELSVFYNM